MSAICLDQRKPARIGETHGMWRLTIRMPLPGLRDLHIGAATGRYWVANVHRWGVAVPWLNVCFPIVSSPTWRPKVSLSRWCAHVKVAYEDEQ